MRTIIQSQSYLFAINLTNEENICHFGIIANNLEDKTKSSITNLNFILSELIEPITQFDDYETTISVDKNIGREIYKNAVRLFNDLDWLKHLEVALEDDRSAGEWEQ